MQRKCRRAVCFLVLVSGFCVSYVYFSNFQFGTRLPSMNKLNMSSQNVVTNPLSATTQSPLNMTSQNIVNNPLNVTIQPPFNMTNQNLVANLLNISAEPPFNMTSHNFIAILLNVTTQSPVDRRHYICYVAQGRLGNHLFQYASIYGIATINNLSIMTPKSCEICRYFRVKNVTASNDTNACSKFKVFSETMPRVFTTSLLTLPRDIDISLRGYFESWKYFQNVTDSLREQFRFKEPIETMARREMDTLKSKYINRTGSNVTVIGIHVRMGDIFDDPQFHQKCLDPAPLGYINKSMEYYMDKYNTILFIVCSDTIIQAKATIESLNLTVTIHYMEDKRKPIDDLAILSKCDHVIQTVGTFGWWAAYLSGGTSVYYKFPGRQGSSAEKQFNNFDFFYPEWTGLDAD